MHSILTISSRRNCVQYTGYSPFTAILLPEPGYLIAAELAQDVKQLESTSAVAPSQPVTTTSPEQAATISPETTTIVTPPVAGEIINQPAQQTCKVDGVEMPDHTQYYQFNTINHTI